VLVWTKDHDGWIAEARGRTYRITGWAPCYQATVAADGHNRTLALAGGVEQAKAACERDYVKHAGDLPTR
jgi:hypothetical protein